MPVHLKRKSTAPLDRKNSVTAEQGMTNLPPQQVYYCIKVTSLSHEVTEDDVVVCIYIGQVLMISLVGYSF